MFDINEQPLLKDLEAGQQFTGVVFIQKAELRTTKNNTLYWDITASDNSTQVACRIFDASGREGIEAGRIAYVVGTTEIYQNAIQIKFSRVTMADTKKPEILERVLPVSYMKKEEAQEKFDGIMSRIKREEIKELVRKVIDKCGGIEMYFTNSAAISVHHSEIGALAVHSIEVAKIAYVMATMYNANMDVVLAAALLHDVAKLLEYQYSQYGLASEMTIRGLLFGHLSIGSEIILRTAEELNIDEITALNIAHCVASHHGVLQYGAVAKPATLEAAIISEADGSSARITQYKNVLNTLDDGGVSEAIRTLDGTRIWKPKVGELHESI